jgi:hypothetical protein
VTDVLLTRAFAPALLADVHHAYMAIFRLRGEPLDDATRRRLALREADLLRRVLAEDALAQVQGIPWAGAPEEGPLARDAIRAHALLELGRIDEAKTVVPFVPDPIVAALLAGRIAYAEGRLDEADAAWTDASGSSNPEVEAEALAFLVRLRASRRQDVAADLDRLEALCERHAAGFSQAIVRGLRLLVQAGVAPGVAEGLARGARAALEARYTLGVEHERASVGAVPLEVHGAARAHRNDPKAYVTAVLSLASLAWATGDKAQGYAVAWYGSRIGGRLFPGESVADLAIYLRELEATLTAEEVGIVQQALLDPTRGIRLRTPTT